MSRSFRMLPLLALFAILGCVSSDGRKPIKQEDPKLAAAKINIQLGTTYLQQGNFPLAREKLERSLKQNPRDPDVHTSLGLLYDRTGDAKLADKHFREALRLAPEKPDLINNYAIYLCKNGRVDEGVEKFVAIAGNKFYPTPEVALTNAGVCLRGAKRDTQAAMSFQRALQIKPNFAEAAYQLADLDFRRGEIQSARDTVDSYIGAFEPTPDLLLIGVQIARKQGDRLAEEKFARKLRMDFPSSDQTRALAELSHNSG